MSELGKRGLFQRKKGYSMPILFGPCLQVVRPVFQSMVFALCVVSCVSTGSETKEEMAVEKTGQGAHTVRSWAYWLQDPIPQSVAELPVDLVVIDYSADGSDDLAWDALEVAQMARSDKQIWAYFSIGEAESYRFYWKSEWADAPPSFLGPENEDWAENYKVRYWQEEWWETALRPYLDRILAAGFDGVYLDIIDAYWFWMERGEPREVVAEGMAKLVCRIAEYCRAGNGPSFAVCPQNGMGLINELSPEWRNRYLTAISAIGVESLFFNLFSAEDGRRRRELVRVFQGYGLSVLNVEYISGDRIREYRQKVAGSGLQVVLFRAEPDQALDRVLPPLR